MDDALTLNVPHLSWITSYQSCHWSGKSDEGWKSPLECPWLWLNTLTQFHGKVDPKVEWIHGKLRNMSPLLIWQKVCMWVYEAKNPKSWIGSLLIRVVVTQSTKLGARRTLLLQHYLSKESHGNKSYETPDPHLGITSATSAATPTGSHQQIKKYNLTWQQWKQQNRSS